MASPGFSPAARDVEPLFALLGGDDDSLTKHAARGLSRLGKDGAREAMRRFDAATPPLRGRLAALVGRIAVRVSERELAAWLEARLDDADPTTRRRAILAVGKLGAPDVSRKLLAAWEKGASLPELRTLATALGNVGGEAVIAALATRSGVDPELDRIVGEARLKIERRVLRREPSSIDARVSPREPLAVLLHVRAGLEQILLDELADRTARVAGRGRVELKWRGPLERLFRARTFLHIGFPLPPATVAAGGDDIDAVADVIAGTDAWDVLSAVTRGPIRYRLEWADHGRRRSGTFRVAERVGERRPALVNDSTDAVWEFVVSERVVDGHSRLFVELWPRALVDPRFTYRRDVLPASSHPTLAAALARVAGRRADDVVWDPFAGAGTELIERARFGPYAALHGSDTDPRALAAARTNFAAAAITDAQLFVGDARTARPPEAPSLVLTNPPFGHRVLERHEIEPLLVATLKNIRDVLRSDGRVAWVSPLPDVTAHVAERAGFFVALRQSVDVGGFPAEIQLLRAGRATPERSRGGSSS
jgi:predicted RNA methylase